MQRSSNYPGMDSSKSVPVYPVILFVVAFLYLVGVMSWQVWKDHKYHIDITSSTVKNRVVLFHDFFRVQLEPVSRLLSERYDTPFLKLEDFDRFYLEISKSSPLVNSVALVDSNSRIVKDSGVPYRMSLVNLQMRHFGLTIVVQYLDYEYWIPSRVIYSIEEKVIKVT